LIVRAVLLYATMGRGQKKCEDEGQCDKFGTLTITIDSRPFALKTIGEHYEHTGWVEALAFRVCSNTLYYIGEPKHPKLMQNAKKTKKSLKGLFMVQALV
jgi:hypothetical protein